MPPRALLVCRTPRRPLRQTLSQILDQTMPDFNFLTAARSQDQIDVITKFSMFGGDAVGFSVVTRHMLYKCYAPARNLVTIIESSL
jgi:hypothetical protein